MSTLKATWPQCHYSSISQNSSAQSNFIEREPSKEHLQSNEWYRAPENIRYGEFQAEKERQIGHQIELQGGGTGQQEDPVAIVALLRTCAKRRDIHTGSRIHAQISKAGLPSMNLYVGTGLVNMYSKCGALKEAQQVFDELLVRNVIAWNVLITGYAQQGHYHEALTCFGQMQEQGYCPDAVTFICVLKACSCIGDAKKGENFHSLIVRLRLLGNSIIVGNALVDMYMKFGALSKAQDVFNELSVRNVISWNLLIAGYIQHGHVHEVLHYFDGMQDEGLSPNEITFMLVLRACGVITAAEKGKDVHAQVARQGLLMKNTVLGTALVDMYAKCGLLEKACKVFDELPVQDVVSWSALIAGYAKHQHCHEALDCYKQMQQNGLSADAVTFICILQAVASAEKGRYIHAEVIRKGLLGMNVSLNTALVDMYVKCGELEKAQEVFDELPFKNVVSWNSLITGYVQHGHAHKAIKCFEQMKQEGFCPDIFTFSSILKACGSITVAKKGEEVHAEVAMQGLLHKDCVIGTALVDMYAKCGVLSKAQGVFDELPIQNIVSWSVLLTGYAYFGNSDSVFNAVNKMIKDGLGSDVVTFNVLLNACTHLGLVYEGQIHFRTMILGYSIMPTLEHYTCMLNLFGQAGHFSRALAVMNKMQNCGPDCLQLCYALIGACLKWENVQIGQMAFHYLIEIDK